MSPVGKIVFAAALLLATRGLARTQSSGSASPKQREIADLMQVAYAGDTAAQLKLALIYLTGDGVSKDDSEALKWLRKAAEQDNPVAERYLAEMYFKGRGVPANNAEAAKWLRLAAEQGDAESQHNLSVLYSQGLGVPRNLKQAADWMRKAAEQNLPAGQLGMGILYENGEGVPPDAVEAAKWYQKAVDQGSTAATNQLALLMATSTNPSVRNPKGAIALATKAVAAAMNSDYLDTLAAAYFADGQFDKAVEAEQKALARSPENDSYQKSLEKYLSAAHGSH